MSFTVHGTGKMLQYPCFLFYFNPVEVERNQDETVSFLNNVDVADPCAVPSNSGIVL